MGAMDSNSTLKLKYGVDKILATLLVVILLPLLVLITVAILIENLVHSDSRGPVFIFDRRITEGRPFRMIKFRTYFVQDDPKHADKIGTTDFINLRAMTSVGSFLRRYYFDELPQLINILKGDMSFIGPRPIPEKEYRKILGCGYRSKSLLRAGLGGPGQAMKGKMVEFQGGLKADEKLINLYDQASALKILLIDFDIMWSSLKKVIEADGLEDPNR